MSGYSLRDKLYEAWAYYNRLSNQSGFKPQKNMYLGLSRLSGFLMRGLQREGTIQLDLEDIARTLELSQRTVRENVRVILQRSGYADAKVHYEKAA